MTSPDNNNAPREYQPTSDSLNVQLIIVVGNEDTTIRPPRPSLALHAAHERDRAANPTAPRPYRPCLTPPPHDVPPPPDALPGPAAAPAPDAPDAPRRP